MGKNTRWSADDLKKKGLVQNDKGDFVPVKSLVNTGKVENIIPEVQKFKMGISANIQARNSNPKPVKISQVVKDYLADPARQTKDLELATGFAMMIKKQMAAGIDPVDAINQPVRTYIKDDKLLQELIEVSKFYGTAILEEKNFTLPDGERITVKHFFDINPCPAPRMTRSDQWKVDPFHKDPEKRQRPVITRYFAWRDAFKLLSSQKGYVLDERLHAVFVFPFPEYFSKKKRSYLLHQPHKQRPDADNNAKSIMDCFGVDDGYVWDLRAVKLWGEKGQILIF